MTHAPVDALPATALAVPDTPRTPLGNPLTPETLRTMLANRRRQDNGWTPIKVAAFIEALAETCSVAKAASYVEMSAAAAYKLRNHPDAQAFREAWDGAMAPRFEELSDIAMDRVRNGVVKNRWWQGELVGTDVLYSDRLLVHMLNRTDPDRVAASRAAAEALPPPIAEPLPMAEDFIVAAATATGALGWDPTADIDEFPLPDDIEAAMAERRARHAAGAAEEIRLREYSDTLTKSWLDLTDLAELRAAQNRAAMGVPNDSQLDRFLQEDECYDRAMAELTGSSTLSTLEQRRRQSKKPRSAARVSSGASSGRK